MARIDISGIGIDYELLGQDGAPAIALTPGGRFPKDSPGLRELGQELVAKGRRVLLWDRPNCGLSDLCLEGEHESEMHALTLTKLIRALKLGPTVLAAGSAGSRVSLIAASRDPDIVSHLTLWWISGGPIGLMSLGNYYCGEPAMAVNVGGMQALASAPSWAESFKRNPKNLEVLKTYDPVRFVETMQRWAAAYAPSSTSPVPGMKREDFARLTMPVLIFRSGVSDLSHTRRTSEWVHELIPQSEMIEPPWPDDEWNSRAAAQARGEGLFARWPLLAPPILDFLARHPSK